jgi:hypothetical protein
MQFKARGEARQAVRVKHPGQAWSNFLKDLSNNSEDPRHPDCKPDEPEIDSDRGTGLPDDAADQ